MERKRLRVDGIPNDIPVERAKDKLTIHFLRTRNGGGEVEDIEILSGPPLHAIITFEDDKVIGSVLKIKNHALKIKDKTYNLEVSKVPGKLKLDEVFKKASLSVNYKILPEKLKYILKGFRKMYKDVKFDFDEKSNICEISGSYTKIQILSQEITKNISLKEDSLDLHSQAQTNQSILREHLDLTTVSQVGDYRSIGQHASSNQVRYFPRGETDEQEPFVWDSDIFRYIKRFHGSQYREILNKYNVQAIEEISDEITTISLQPTQEDKDYLTFLRDAQINLIGLYQGLEQFLRKEQIDKRDLNCDKYIDRILKDLKRLFPKLLCHEDDQYLFIIGNSGDVALGKQHIIDLQLKLKNPTSSLHPYDMQSTGVQFNNPTSSLHPYNMQSTGDQFKNPTSSLHLYNMQSMEGHLSTAVGQEDLMSLSYKLDNHRGNRIAAMFNPPTDNSSYLKSQLDVKHLSCNSNNKHKDDIKHSPGSNKTIDNTSLAHINTAEDCSFLQVNAKSSSKGIAQIKKMELLQALKTGRVDLSRSTTKSIQKIQPVQISKASSELAYSSLVDTVPHSFHFKPAEAKLRRTSSFSHLNAKDASDHQDGTSQFKDEICIENWLWQYIKEFHRSDIDAWFAEVTLTEEKYKESTVLKLNAYSNTKLWSTMRHILILCKEKRETFSKSCFQYSFLGAKGPDDIAAIEKWCSVFRNCSNELCIKLEKDHMLVIYPKLAEKRVLEECTGSCFLENNKSTDTLSLVSNSHSSLDTVSKEQGKESEYSSQNETENYVKYLDRNYLEGPENFAIKSMKCIEVQKKEIAGGKSKGFTEDNLSFNSFFPALQNENTQKPLQMNEIQHFLKSDIFLKDLDSLKLKSSDIKNAQEYVYGSSLAETMDSPLILSELRRPAVGQESDPVDQVCDHCKSDGSASTLACGHYLCNNCQIAFKDSCCICSDQIAHDNKSYKKSTKMTYKSMTLSLPGYERNTSIKIKYEVSNGIQGEDDPHPGKPYTGGVFEAYLPENSEGKKLLSLLEKALSQNLTFTVNSMEHGDCVTWHKIPHKTSPFGGIGKRGYPDSQYIKKTLALLKELGIE